MEREEDATQNISLSELSREEQKLLTILRNIKYGDVKIVMQDGIPVRVDIIRESIKI